MSPADLRAALSWWIVKFSALIRWRGSIRERFYKIDDTDYIFGWDEEDGTLTLWRAGDEGYSVAIRTRRRLQRVCACLVFAQAAACSVRSE